LIPEPEVEISPTDQARFQLTKLASALVIDGVPVDLVMLDAREGCEHATRLLAKRGRS
jgi:hypothetical protein